eukprot:11409925-Alexandrium_andersonii.AAC.1
MPSIDEKNFILGVTEMLHQPYLLARFLLTLAVVVLGFFLMFGTGHGQDSRELAAGIGENCLMGDSGASDHIVPRDWAPRIPIRR